MATLIDLSHTIEDGMITYRGLPAPIVCDFLSREASRSHYAPGTEFHIGRIDMVANTGTYLDSPFHRFADGADVSALSLDQVAALPLVVINVTHLPSRAVTPEVLDDVDIMGCAVLFHTGWSRHWRTDAYFEGHPFLTEETAEALHEGGAELAGIDSLNIDDTDDGRRPVHTRLLGAGILIVEHLTNLYLLSAEHSYLFYAVPVRVRGLGTFPVRAFVEQLD
jgi:kynurenine formamidase